MRYRVFACVGLLLLAGCLGRPFNVCSTSKVSVAGPVTANVAADLQPRTNLEPLRAITVAGVHLPAACPRIALLDVDGLLVNGNLVGPYSAGENPVDLLREKLDAIAADPQVVAVVLRINSPGGGVTATDLMCHEIQRFRARTGRPVVAYLMDLATGGAYYLATAADVIYAHPTSITGGIGVILNLYNLHDTMSLIQAFAQPIKAGEYIDMGTCLDQLPQEARDMLQAMANEFHERFKGVVAGRRPQVKADDPTNFDGRVFTAAQAQSRGLVDQIGYLDDAIKEAQVRARVEQARVVMFRRPNDPARAPFAITANNPPQGKWSPVSVPGLDRSRLPTFLYLWQVEPTLERGGGQ